MYFFKNSKNQFFLKKMYFFKIPKKIKRIIYKMERKKCLSGVTLKLKKIKRNLENLKNLVKYIKYG